VHVTKLSTYLHSYVVRMCYSEVEREFERNHEQLTSNQQMQSSVAETSHSNTSMCTLHTQQILRQILEIPIYKTQD